MSAWPAGDDRPADVQVSGATGRRINLYLYEVGENGHLRNQNRRASAIPGRTGIHPSPSISTTSSPRTARPRARQTPTSRPRWRSATRCWSCTTSQSSTSSWRSPAADRHRRRSDPGPDPPGRIRARQDRPGAGRRRGACQNLDRATSGELPALGLVPDLGRPDREPPAAPSRPAGPRPASPHRRAGPARIADGTAPLPPVARPAMPASPSSRS